MASPGRANLPDPTEPLADWDRYRDNAARHLIGISRDLQARVMQRLAADHGYRDLRPSLGPFLSLVSLEAHPLTAIAAQLAISKQACSQLANLAERAGYVSREVDPRDRRSRVIRLSADGRKLVAHAVEIILETESEYSDHVGTAAYERFTTSLATLFRGLGIPTHDDEALITTAGRSIGVLPLIAVRVQQDLMQATTAQGHAGLKMSHGQVLPLIGPGGARVREISQVQRVSRQAISATARDLQNLGYLKSEADPGDGRGVVLQLTEQGTHLIRDSVRALDALEVECRRILGARRIDHLRHVARNLYRALHLEEEIFAATNDSRSAQPDEDSRRNARGRHDIRGLAKSLRRQLGHRDAARLAALLEPRAKRVAT